MTLPARAPLSERGIHNAPQTTPCTWIPPNYPLSLPLEMLRKQLQAAQQLNDYLISK